MDWIRRNWPDLLIGVALVAVIAMIVATLLSGGSLPSLLQRNTPPELPITRTTGQTNSPANGANGNAPATTNTPSTASGDIGSGDTETSTTNTQDSNLDVFVPGTSAGTDTDTGANAGTETEAAGDTEAGTVGAATDGAAPANSNTAANTGVNTPLPQSVPNGGFRVAAGAVDSRESALTAAQTFRDADYTVTVEQQDDLYLLWIGPYASDAGAERVAARLQEDGLVPDALVYTYDPDDGAEANAADEAEGEAGAEAATPIPDNAATNTPQANPNASANSGANANAQSGSSGAGAAASPDTGNTGLSAPAGQRFLQVGAFRSDETAQPQLEQLESLGLTVTSDEDDEGIVRLYVGPFNGAQLAQTQTRLSNQGIDSFPVTP